MSISTKVGVCFVAFFICVATNAQNSYRPQGSIVAWGENGLAHTTVPGHPATVVAVDTGVHNHLALTSDGHIFGWERYDAGSPWHVPPLSGVIDIAVAGWSGAALLFDGGVETWGHIDSSPADLSNVVQIDGGVGSLGRGFLAALRDDGRIVAWGDNTYGQTNIPSKVSNIVAIAAGSEHVLALRADGTVWPHKPGISNVVAIAAGENRSLALTSSGEVILWGNPYPGPEETVEAVAISVGQLHGLAVSPEHTVVAWGVNDSGETDVPPGLSNVVAVTAGMDVSFAITADSPTAIPVPGVSCYVNGKLGRYAPMVSRGRATVALNTTFPGLIYYTTDGSDPVANGSAYENPFIVETSSVIRAVAFTADLTKSWEMLPLQVEVAPYLGVTTSGGGTVIAAPPSGSYSEAGTVDLTATPAPGFTFLQWLGDVSGTDGRATLEMNHNRHVKAVFGTSVSTSIIGPGEVTVRPRSDAYPYGQTVTLTAVPQDGRQFVSWGGSAGGTNNPVSVVVTQANMVVNAAFSALPAFSHTLTVVSEGQGTVGMDPFANRYIKGESVSLLAVAEVGQAFLGWSGDVDGQENPLVVTVDTNLIVTANFTARPWMDIAEPLARMTPDGFRVQVRGEFGQVYEVQRSITLPTWEMIGTVTNTFGTSQLTDGEAAVLNGAFYRAEAR